MRFLLDTNHWSYVQRRHPQVVARVAALAPDDVLHISVISQGELLGGVESLPDGRRKSELRRLYEDVIRSAGLVIPVQAAIAERYAILVAQLRRAGRPIVTNDIWIGATALVLELVLVTNDAHFGHIDGLRIENWTN